jgi:hypothetical protein
VLAQVDVRQAPPPSSPRQDKEAGIPSAARDGSERRPGRERGPDRHPDPDASVGILRLSQDSANGTWCAHICTSRAESGGSGHERRPDLDGR